MTFSGNSLLLQFTEKNLGSVVNSNQQSANRDQPPLKKKKIEQPSDWMASDVADIHDIDLEVYGTRIDNVHETTTSTITSYNFEVCSKEIVMVHRFSLVRISYCVGTCRVTQKQKQTKVFTNHVRGFVDSYSGSCSK